MERKAFLTRMITTAIRQLIQNFVSGQLVNDPYYYFNVTFMVHRPSITNKHCLWSIAPVLQTRNVYGPSPQYYKQALFTVHRPSITNKHCLRSNAPVLQTSTVYSVFFGGSHVFL